MLLIESQPKFSTSQQKLHPKFRQEYIINTSEEFCIYQGGIYLHTGLRGFIDKGELLKDKNNTAYLRLSVHAVQIYTYGKYEH